MNGRAWLGGFAAGGVCICAPYRQSVSGGAFGHGGGIRVCECLEHRVQLTHMMTAPTPTATRVTHLADLLLSVDSAYG